MVNKKSSSPPTDATTLRQRAESLLRASTADMPTMATTDVQALIYELNVHQIELEIQNEELRQSQLELAHSRDRYSDLYEFAPVGYVTLDKDGRIHEANLTVATFLGVERKSLVGANLSNWIDHDAQDNFFLHRRSVFSDNGGQICEVNMHKSDGTPMAVRLESIAQDTAHPRQCRTALIDVTLQQAAQSALRELTRTLEQRVVEQTHQVQLLAAAVSHLAEGIVITDDELDWPGPRIRFVNEAMCRITGYTADELIGQTPRILQGKQTDKRTRTRVKRELAADRPVLCEFINYRKDGTPYDAELYITPLFNSEGRRTNFVSVHRDITERKQAQEALRESESRLAAEVAGLARLNEASSRLWRMPTLREGLEEMLAATIELLGADKGNIQLLDASRGVLTIETHYGFEQDFLDFFREVSAEDDSACGRALRCGERMVIKDVETDPLYAPYREIARTAGYRGVQSTLLMGIGGNPLGLISTHFRMPHVPDEQDLRRLDLYARQAADFIQRCRSDEVIRERKARLRAVLNTAADAIITIDRRGIIIDVNPATERMFGYTRDELVGHNVKILMPLPYHDEHDGYIQCYLETAVARVIGIGREVVGRRKNGSLFPIELAVSEIDHLRLFTGVIRDISERHKLQREVLGIAEDEQRRIGQDLHDSVQQELAGLGMLAETLLENLAKATDKPGTLQLSRLRELALKVSHGIARTHQDVHAIARGLVPVRIDTHGLMDALRELAHRTDDLAGVTCAFKCEQPVEISDTATSTHLYRVAQEAITNALTHGRPEHILIALESENGQPILQIADDGTGFDVTKQTGGLGLKTMLYRASLIGADLKVSPVETGGTLVTCRVYLGGG